MTRKTTALKFLTIAAFICMLALSGCSKGKKDIQVDTAALAKELYEASVTSAELTAAQENILLSTYFIAEDAFAGGTAYLSSGSSGCEVAVIECKEAKQTADVEKLFKDRVSTRSELFASYAPEEVTKIDAAIVKSAGKYSVLCICDDTAKAEEVLKKYGF